MVHESVWSMEGKDLSLKDKIQAAREDREPVVMPMVNKWLMANPNHIWSDESIDLARSILRRREKTYPYERHSPSSFNGCMRKSVIMFKGYKGKDPEEYRTWRLFLDGNFGHLKWQMTLFEMGILRKAEVPVLIPDMKAGGTCDGILGIPKEGYDPKMTRAEVLDLASGDNLISSSLEVKNHNEYIWKLNKGQPKENTEWQGHLYTHGIRKMAALHDDYPEVTHTCFIIDNKNTSEVIEHFVEWDDKWVKKLKRYYNKVNSFAELDQLPKRGFERGSTQCKYCPVRDVCEDKIDNDDDTIETHPDAEYGDFSIEDLS